MVLEISSRTSLSRSEISGSPGVIDNAYVTVISCVDEATGSDVPRDSERWILDNDRKDARLVQVRCTQLPNEVPARWPYDTIDTRRCNVCRAISADLEEWTRDELEFSVRMSEIEMRRSPRSLGSLHARCKSKSLGEQLDRSFVATFEMSARMQNFQSRTHFSL